MQVSLLFLLLALLATNRIVAEEESWFSDLPAATTVASTLLPGEEYADPRHPGATLVAWGGKAYRRLGQRYFDEEGRCWMALTVTTTCYVPVREQCDNDPEKTSIGNPAYTTYGIATDPKALPYGTTLRIPGYGEAKVDDTGGAMRQDWRLRGVVHLDLRIPFLRADGVWRDPATCNRVAFKHGVKPDRIVLVEVPEATMAARETTRVAIP